MTDIVLLYSRHRTLTNNHASYAHVYRQVHTFRKVHKCVAVRVCGATLHKRVQVVAVQLAEVARLRAALTAHSHNALTSGFTSEHRSLFIAGASHNMQATRILLKPAPCRRAPRQLAAAEENHHAQMPVMSFGGGR